MLYCINGSDTGNEFVVVCLFVVLFLDLRLQGLLAFFGLRREDPRDEAVLNHNLDFPSLCTFVLQPVVLFVTSNKDHDLRLVP